MSRSSGILRQPDMSDSVITGSTGAVAPFPSAICSPTAYIVTCLTCWADGSEQLASLGMDAVEADVLDEASLSRAFDGADALDQPADPQPNAHRPRAPPPR